MRDDLGIITKLENGKAYLEFVLPEKIGRLLSALQIEIWEEAEGERLVFHGEYAPEESDCMTALLLRPHLWDGLGSLCLSGEGAGKIQKRGVWRKDGWYGEGGKVRFC